MTTARKVNVSGTRGDTKLAKVPGRNVFSFVFSFVGFVFEAGFAACSAHEVDARNPSQRHGRVNKSS